MTPSYLVIFDCDGVLVDSELIACRIEAEELSRIGYTISPEENVRRFSGKSQKDVMETVERELGSPLPLDFEERLDNRVFEALSRELKPMEGIENILLDSPWKCVASSGSPERIRSSLEITGLSEYFPSHAIYNANMVLNGKPAPDLFLHAANQMEATPNQCIVIEDSVHGIRAGKAAGMYVVGFIGGSHIMDADHHNALKRAGADEICTHMTDISAHLSQFSVSD